MKLSQIYANLPFDRVQFRDGLNVVAARVTNKGDMSKDSHNLGKSSLLSVIDYMLLKTLTKDNHIFALQQDKLRNYIFYLEIELNSGWFLTIRRSVDKATNTKIAFRKHQEQYQDFSAEGSEWDYEDMALAEAKRFLNQQLEFTILPNVDYRKSLTYFLRGQSDYQDVFQLEKFKRGKDKDWKPFLFELLGFQSDLLKKKYELTVIQEEQQKTIEGIERNFSVNVNEVDKIRGAIELKEQQYEALDRFVSNFKFYEEEKELNRNLIENLEARISSLNTNRYNLSYELDKVTTSIRQHRSFDVKKMKKIFEEVHILLPESLVKSYEELEEFNISITNERNKHLRERKKQLQEQLQSIDKELEELDQKRSDYLSALQDKDSFQKFKRYQRELTEVSNEIARLQEKLQNVDTLSVMQDKMLEVEHKIKDLGSKIRKEIDTQPTTYLTIRKSFSNIVDEVLNVPALLYIDRNKEENVTFHAEIQNAKETEITAAGRGSTYKKFLCAAFDISVISTYSSASFYRFAYHDGIFEGVDNRKKINFINLIRKYCQQYNLQYIFTAIEDDLPHSEADDFEGVSEAEIVLTLHDADESGTLFKQIF